ncbi:hypothetical protein ACFWYW_39095 [Nonomuraea sp. NPDC059023]|uniref:hypothetical protein n=1 Tax=unclassified Nonomuraea TaxID=2593643 RepID=UPI00368D301B
MLHSLEIGSTVLVRLSRCATTAGIVRLASLAFDEDRAVALAAVTTLANLDDPLIIDPLIAIVSCELPNPYRGQADPRHVIATKALARLAKERAVAAIAEKAVASLGPSAVSERAAATDRHGTAPGAGGS